jgi:hypothetical protein
MTLPFVALMDLVLLTRLVLISDAPLAARRAVPLIVVQAAGVFLLLRFSIPTFGLAVALAALGGGLWAADGRPRRREPAQSRVDQGRGATRRPDAWYRIRLLFLLADGIALAVFLAPWSRPLVWPWLPGAVRALPGYVIFPTLSRASALQAGTILMGVLLVVNEANLVVRAVLYSAGIKPTPLPPPEERVPAPAEAHPVRRSARWPWSAHRPAPTALTVPRGPAPASATGASETRQLAVGGIIGILERLLVLAVALAGQYSAIAFIIAAKAFARRELEQRAFAEYVLVGTLLSVLLALSVALLMRALGV